MQEKRTFSCKILQERFYWVFPRMAGYKFSGNNFGITGCLQAYNERFMKTKWLKNSEICQTLK